jgi:hypothetical protein
LDPPTDALPSFIETPQGFNCQPLHEDLQVRWQVNGDSLDIELIGNIDESVYMGFGISGSDIDTKMVGADAVLCDEFEGQFRAVDFYLSAKQPCTNGAGVCADQPNGLTNDISLVSGGRDASTGITVVRYTRPLTPSNLGANVGGQAVDRSISVQPGESTFVVWAIGPVDGGSGLPQFHSIAYPSDDVSIEFGRSVQDNCEPLVEGEVDEEEPADIVPFFRPVLSGVTEFTARIGPPADPKGYTAITGQEAFGVSWCKSNLVFGCFPIEVFSSKNYS